MALSWRTRPSSSQEIIEGSAKGSTRDARISACKLPRVRSLCRAYAGVVWVFGAGTIKADRCWPGGSLHADRLVRMVGTVGGNRIGSWRLSSIRWRAVRRLPSKPRVVGWLHAGVHTERDPEDDVLPRLCDDCRITAGESRVSRAKRSGPVCAVCSRLLIDLRLQQHRRQ